MFGRFESCQKVQVPRCVSLTLNLGRWNFQPSQGIERFERLEPLAPQTPRRSAQRDCGAVAIREVAETQACDKRCFRVSGIPENVEVHHRCRIRQRIDKRS